MLSGKANYRFHAKNNLMNSPPSSESSEKDSHRIHHVKHGSTATRLKSAGETRAKIRNALSRVGKKIHTIESVIGRFKAAKNDKYDEETMSARNETLQKTRPFSSQAKY